MKKLSVIVPAYNAAGFITESLDSVVMQESTIEYEIVIVNDGSKDDTQKVCERYAALHPNVNIKLIYQENAGVSCARNQGIAAATGEWITFLDSDDFLLPGALDIVNEEIMTEMDVALCGYTRDVHDRTLEGYSDYATPLEAELLAGCALRYAKYFKQIQKKFPIDTMLNWTCWGKFFRREWLIKYDLCFPVNIFTSEDFLFLLQVYAQKPRVYGINTVIYCYKGNSQSVTRIANFNSNLADNYARIFNVLNTVFSDGRYEKDIDSYISASIIDCIKRYSMFYRLNNRKINHDELYAILRVFYDAGHHIRLMRCSLTKNFIGRKNKIICTIWLFKLKNIYSRMINSQECYYSY